MQKKSIITLKHTIKNKNNNFRFALNNNNNDDDDDDNDYNNHLNVPHDVIFANVIILLYIRQPCNGNFW